MNQYRWDPEDYAKHSKAQQEWAHELIRKLSLRGDEALLDLGCGDGKVTAELASLLSNGFVMGVDSSSEMIALAAEKFSSEQYPNLSFLQMDARKLPFLNRFDVIFSNAALHWVKDHQPVVRGLFRSLKPGGKILLQMGGEGNAQVLVSVLEQAISSPDWKAYFQNFEFPYGFLSVEKYRSLLKEVGFQAKRVELIPKDMQQADASAFEAWVRTTWLPYTGRIPEERRGRFISETVAHYLERVPPDADGTVHVAMVRIQIEAMKSSKVLL